MNTSYVSNSLTVSFSNTPQELSPLSLPSQESWNDTFKSEIASNKVLLYAKGSKEAPQCGFSARVIQILQSYGVEFTVINVLQDEGRKEALKKFSNWPTIPQLYVAGDFIGGCDIVTEMHINGELKAELERINS